jgi:uncharacterized protein (UPF0303 family)
MDLQTEIERVRAQEAALTCAPFGAQRAWELGVALREAALARSASLCIVVRLSGHTVFLHAMPGTNPSNADWARRKSNTVELLGRSSYAVGLQMAQENTTLADKMGLPLRDYASHGGCVPLRDASGTVWGSVGVSGLPQLQDHELVVEVLGAFVESTRA